MMVTTILVQALKDTGMQAPHFPRLMDLNPMSILIIQIVILASALLILWWMLRGHYRKKMFHKDDTPLDILKKRYAAGEIKKETYDQLKKDIGA